ncbi:MAG: TldD/PmbA family protein, partial [Bacteroidales bacterium]|nr:TldD/PmbA family protein [Bacteroidales bacterium]
MERRNFIKTGGVALLGTMAPLRVMQAQMSNTPAGLPKMLTHFGVTENDLRQVIAVALEKGGDYADLYFEHTLWNSLGLQDGAVNRAGSDIQYGVGIRVVAGDQTGYAYVENVAVAEMLKAARTASRIASGSARTPPVKVDGQTFKNHYPILQSWEEVSVQTKMPYLQKLNDRIFALDPRVTKVNASINDSTSYILYYNSEGTLCHDYRPMAIVSGMCIMQEGDRIENSYSSRAG